MAGQAKIMESLRAARVQARPLDDVALQFMALGIRKADNAPCHGLEIVATPERLHDSPGGVAVRTQQKMARLMRHHGPQDKLRRNIRTPRDLLDPIENRLALLLQSLSGGIDANPSASPDAVDFIAIAAGRMFTSKSSGVSGPWQSG